MFLHAANTLTPNDWPEWAHATSKDLYSWTNHGTTIPADRSIPLGSPWTGSVVIDSENTSGFFPLGQKDGVVAMFTQTTLAEEAQALAWSRNGGYDFTFFWGNPVLSRKQHGFRDPYAIPEDRDLSLRIRCLGDGKSTSIGVPGAVASL
ncbi:hypothetical protein LTR28_013248 [Elasticomyces elasticus]|nr:hypothetical protein LTR28_013248 [Elasticomyces elasticus]